MSPESSSELGAQPEITKAPTPAMAAAVMKREIFTFPPVQGVVCRGTIDPGTDGKTLSAGCELFKT